MDSLQLQFFAQHVKEAEKEKQNTNSIRNAALLGGTALGLGGLSIALHRGSRGASSKATKATGDAVHKAQSVGGGGGSAIGGYTHALRKSMAEVPTVAETATTDKRRTRKIVKEVMNDAAKGSAPSKTKGSAPSKAKGLQRKALPDVYYRDADVRKRVYDAKKRDMAAEAASYRRNYALRKKGRDNELADINARQKAFADKRRRKKLRIANEEDMYESVSKLIGRPLTLEDKTRLRHYTSKGSDSTRFAAIEQARKDSRGARAYLGSIGIK